ncbi:hypothetical protein C1Y63_09605 [Corynebacterium sp. 13CS0277]|uniref:hypothetical protein n=1 Tax=Corynebacterium sp. 13CS0277 TaxID=2071994 RepID=UPI000D0270E5|nr:hypothetical protein [Corynebacterium sp. 13CS0277]PRQ10792.1 hypothetical protein C1Y63_09605 [Corynebacterium sp. 13CS0277]
MPKLNPQRLALLSLGVFLGACLLLLLVWAALGLLPLDEPAKLLVFAVFGTVCCAALGTALGRALRPWLRGDDHSAHPH